MPEWNLRIELHRLFSIRQPTGGVFESELGIGDPESGRQVIRGILDLALECRDCFFILISSDQKTPVSILNALRLWEVGCQPIVLTECLVELLLCCQVFCPAGTANHFAHRRIPPSKSV